jgi:hypothetical protein
MVFAASSTYLLGFYLPATSWIIDRFIPHSSASKALGRWADGQMGRYDCYQYLQHTFS